jgi:hypothetical protein
MRQMAIDSFFPKRFGVLEQLALQDVNPRAAQTSHHTGRAGSG